MAMSSSASASFIALLLSLVFLPGRHCETLDRNADFSFSFDGLAKNRSFESEFALYGDAEVNGSAVRITRPANSSSGRMAYRKAIRFFGTKPGFSSYFSFSVSPGQGQVLTFFLIPRSVPLGSAKADWFGQSTSLVAVKFGTLDDKKFGNQSGGLLEIDVGRRALMKMSNLSGVALLLSSGEKLDCWIDYDGESKRMEVRLSQSKDSRPVNCSVFSYSVDLSNILWQGAVTVGISTSTANSTQTSSIYLWNFTVKHGSPYLMHSEPLDPNSFLVRPRENPSVRIRRAYPWGVFMAMVLAAACGAMLTFFIMFVWFVLVSRRLVAPVEYPVHPVDVAYGKIVPVGDEQLENGKK